MYYFKIWTISLYLISLVSINCIMYLNKVLIEWEWTSNILRMYMCIWITWKSFNNYINSQLFFGDALGYSWEFGNRSLVCWYCFHFNLSSGFLHNSPSSFVHHWMCKAKGFKICVTNHVLKLTEGNPTSSLHALIISIYVFKFWEV